MSLEAKKDQRIVRCSHTIKNEKRSNMMDNKKGLSGDNPFLLGFRRKASSLANYHYQR